MNYNPEYLFKATYDNLNSDAIGLAVRVENLEIATEYIEIKIFLEENETYTIDVQRSADDERVSTIAQFENLAAEKIYTVIASIKKDGETPFTIKCLVSSESNEAKGKVPGQLPPDFNPGAAEVETPLANLSLSSSGDEDETPTSGIATPSAMISMPDNIAIAPRALLIMRSQAESSSCVAYAATSLMSHLRAIAGAEFEEIYSAAYFFGAESTCQDVSPENMYFYNVPPLTATYGAPRWELHSHDARVWWWSDESGIDTAERPTKSAAIARYTSATTDTRSNAQNQRMTPYNYINFYDGCGCRRCLTAARSCFYRYSSPERV